MTEQGAPATDWKVALKRSRFTSALYDVRRPYDHQLRHWLTETELPFARQTRGESGNVHLAPKYLKIAWPILDGAVVATCGYLSETPQWYQIVGWRAARLCIDVLGLNGPTRKLQHEPNIPTVPELWEEFDRRDASATEWSERAELLLGPGTNELWAVRWLFGNSVIAQNARPPWAPGSGDWGVLGFDESDSADLSSILTASEAEAIGARLVQVSQSEAIRQDPRRPRYRFMASYISTAHRFGVDEFCAETEANGGHLSAASGAMWKQWKERLPETLIAAGCPPELMEDVLLLDERYGDRMSLSLLDAAGRGEDFVKAHRNLRRTYPDLPWRLTH